MNTLIRFKTTTALVLVILARLCFGFLPEAQAVNPPLTPDPGPKPVSNTADGANALASITTGIHNTAIGFDSLLSNTDANFNTGVGSATLLVNTGAENTAVGAGTLLSNTTGGNNTANGAFALFNNTEGSGNNAVGGLALFHNITGNFNTAFGDSALESNTSGDRNVAAGADALTNNIDGEDNTAIGSVALASNRDSGDNTAVGSTALENSTGGANTAVGSGALGNNTTGGANTALGNLAGSNQTTGTNNVYIGAGINGVAAESDTCRIASIFGQTAANGSAVFITSGNKLGTDTSSKRFKEDIKPMDKASEALLALRPVTFRYKKECDPQAKSQFGLVAEDVEKVNPDLVVRDKEGKPYSVRYDQVNAMLLNEFLKEHKQVQELKSTLEKEEEIVAQQQRSFESKLAEQKKQIEALTRGLQRVSAHVLFTKTSSN